MNVAKIYDILLVDDDVDLTNLLTKQISGSGFRCHVEVDLKSAQDYLKDHIPHAIILDINLGTDQSWSLIPWLRSLQQFQTIKIFVSSADLSRGNILKAKALGVDELLAKPLNAAALVQKLKKNLRSTEAVKYQFPHPTEIECSLFAKHVKINEISMVIVSPVKFSEKTDINIQSSFINEMRLNQLKLRTVDLSKPSNDGTYITEVTFRGMTEEIAQKIRKIKKK